MKFIKIIQIIGWIIWMGIFVWVGWQRLDPDFGWHLKTGQLILKHGIPKLDPFSYTMPSYLYVDHAWLIDTIWAKTYSIIGMAGLSIIWGVLTIGITLALTGRDNWSWAEISMWLGLLILIPAFGVRTQIIDWWLWGVLLVIARNVNYWQKWKWYTPVIIGIWANLHGGFVIGLALIVFVAAIRKSWAVIGLCCAAPIVNPYGIYLWKEVGMTVWGNNMREVITEWQPYIGSMTLEFAMFTGAVAMVMVRSWKKISVIDRVVVMGLWAATIYSRRYSQFFMLSALSLIANGIGRLREEIYSDAEKYRRGKIFYKLVLGITGVYTAAVTGWYVNQMTNSENKLVYPEKAIDFVKQDLPEGKIFSSYNWGGYLIWKLPEEKVFVDGRMAIWRRDNAPKGESNNAFADYLDITQKGNIQPYFDKYGVEIVIWPAETNLPADRKRLIELLNGREGKKLIETLRSTGWKETYKDNVAVVYRRPMN